MTNFVKIGFAFSVFFTAISIQSARSQSTVSLDILTLGVHPYAKPNLVFFENQLDANGNICTEPGLALTYETFVRDNRISFRFTTAIFADAAGQMAGYTDILYSRLIFHKWRSSFYLGIGPALLYRESWKILQSVDQIYKPEAKYTTDGAWEILPSAIGRFEYDVFLGRKSDINFAMMYGSSYNTFSVSLGYRFWISTKVKHPKKCNCGEDRFKKKFKDLF